jgi:hypothetical protein
MMVIAVVVRPTLHGEPAIDVTARIAKLTAGRRASVRTVGELRKVTVWPENLAITTRPAIRRALA